MIKASYGQFTYLPTVLPSGFIYSSWNIETPSATEYLPILTVNFGNNGTSLIWKVFDARDTADSAGECTQSQYSTSTQEINGYEVYYGQGNHGDEAWTCINHASGNGYQQPVVISLWVDNDPGRPSAATAMEMVATASNL